VSSARRAFFHPLAELEFLEAVQYYSEIDSDLGKRFVDEVEHAQAQILMFPNASRLVGGAIRRRMVNGFPYSLFYR
jgi:hypothetical protein